MFKKLPNVAVAALLSGTALTTAAEAKDIDYRSFEALFGEPVTVGATGTPQRASDVPLDMTILTAEDIRRSAGRTIPDILRQVPGVSVRQNGADNYDVSIRGYNQPYAERILVLLDGRQVYQDYYGVVQWNNIPVSLSEIKQIEVIKGPNTALYGFNATSGVINIITYNPRHDDFTNVTVSGGTGDYLQGDGTVTVRNDRGGIRATASGYTASQFDTATTFAVNQFENTGDYNRFFKVNGVYEIVDGVDVGLELTDSQSAVNNLSGTQTTINQTDDDTWSMKATVGAETDFGILDFMYFKNQSKPDLIPTPGVTFSFKDNTEVWQLSDTFKLGTDHTFRVLGEYRQVSGNGLFSPSKISYNVKTGSALWNWAINDQLTLSNAVRYDMLDMGRADGNPAYDRELTAISVNSGLVWKVTDADTLRFTYARAVDLPSFLEFDLAPDSKISPINNFGVGYSHFFAEYDTTASANIFYQDIDDMQVAAFGGTDSNPLDSRAYGGEIGLDGAFSGGWVWGVSYAYVNTSDTLTGTRSVTLPTGYQGSQSEHMGTFRLGYAQDKWSADVYANYMSSYEPYGTNITIGNVVLGSAKLNYKVMQNVNLSLTGMATLSGEKAQGAGQKVENAAFGSVSITF